MDDLVTSFLIAGLGSLLTFLAGFASRRIRDWRLRKKYPVAGRFVTEYEDQIAGGIAIRKAMTELKQRGKEVSGVTVDLDGGRAWRLKGTIEKGGFLHGVYNAEDPHDSGQGTFFLKIEGADGDMKDLWAGYDSEISDISQGGYTFRRCPETEIQVAVDADAPSVCALLGDALGALDVDLEDIRSMIATAAISFGWKSSQGCHIDGVMKTAGFSGVSEIPNFWNEDSRSKNSCPECGSVCECAAVVFKRTIDARAAVSLGA